MPDKNPKKEPEKVPENEEEKRAKNRERVARGRPEAETERQQYVGIHSESP